MFLKTVTARRPGLQQGFLNAAFLSGALLAFSDANASQCHRHQCTIIGTAGNDILVGTPSDDVICGLDGDDHIRGRGGNDLICGGKGDDLISGGRGINTLVGGIGDDTIRSISHDDTIFGNQGNNTISILHEGTWVVKGSEGESYTIAGKSVKALQPSVSRTSKVTLAPQTLSATAVETEATSFESLSNALGRTGAETQSLSSPGFTTANNRIYAPDGTEFVPRGVNIFPWALGSANIDGITDCWQFNTVRLHSWILPVMTSQWKDHLVYIDEPLLFDETEDRFRTYDIAPLIEAYTSRGIVVVIDIHDIIGDYFTGANLAMHLQFISQVAEKYKDNPYVWLDVHNEPGNWEGLSGDYSDWRTETPIMLDTVRAIAPNMMLIASGTAWGQDTGPTWRHGDVVPAESALLSNMDIIQGYDNLLVTFHMYDQWKFSYSRVQNFIDQLLAASDAPIYVGEYGSWNGGSTLAASQFLHTLVNVPGYEQIGRSVWTWSAWDNNDLVSAGDGSGYLVDSCETPGNLSPLGTLVWNDNHAGH